MKKSRKKSRKNRLTYKNDWEYRIYFVDGEEINALREVEIAGEKHQVFSWNGTEMVYDMGHKYTCTSLRHFINISFAGKKLPMALETILDKRIAVTATKFVLYEEREIKPCVTRHHVI
jgi:hypothetical protein